MGTAGNWLSRHLLLSRDASVNGLRRTQEEILHDRAFKNHWFPRAKGARKEEWRKTGLVRESEQGEGIKRALIHSLAHSLTRSLIH